MNDKLVDLACRTVGVIDAGVWTFVGKLLYDDLSWKISNYNSLEQIAYLFNPTNPEMALSMYLGSSFVFLPIAALGIADGISDIVTGDHHHLGKVIQKSMKRRSLEASTE